MSKHHAVAEQSMFGIKNTHELVGVLNQCLADTLDLAYQTKQAHWNVKGSNFYSLHLLFDALYTELIVFVDDFAERVVTLGGQAHGTIRAAGAKSQLAEYPLEARDSRIHVDALVDRFSEYTGQMRKTIKEVEHIGDRDTADLCTGVSRAMDKALWMLKSHQEN